jgi:hypothetical protein
MNDSIKPKPGDMVVLTAVPPGLLDGLPQEDQHAITAMVGKPVLLVGYDDDGRAEVCFDDRLTSELTLTATHIASGCRPRLSHSSPRTSNENVADCRRGVQSDSCRTN